MRYFLLIAFIATFASATPAYAERMGNSGLSYTTMGGRKGETPQHMKYQAFQSDEDIAAEEEGAQKKVEEEDAADRVWKKYKALAAGTYKEDEEKPAEEKESEKEKAKQEIAATPDEAKVEPEAGGGIAGIISEYRKNKTRRSQMRTIVVTQPPPKEEPAKEEDPAAKTEPKEKPEG